MATQREDVKLAVMQNDINYIKVELKSVKDMVSSGYVTRGEHDNTIRRIKLLEKIVYTAVGVILLAVLAAIVNSVVKQ